VAVLEPEPAFWKLVRDGYLAVEQTWDRRWSLRAGPYVGSALAGDCLIHVIEKVPGSIAGLLSHATAGAFHVEELSAPATDAGGLVHLLIDAFARRLRQYTSRRRDVAFIRQREVAPLIAGRIRTVDTMRLRARGQPHRVAFDKISLTGATPRNRVYFRALREATALTKIVSIPPAVGREVRTLSLLFSDCRDRETLFRRREHFSGVASRLYESERDPLHRDLLALAGVVLGHVDFDPLANERPDAVPRSWFLNLERLFETAVRTTLARALGHDTRVSAGAEHQRFVFDTERNRAYPDIVLSYRDSTVAIGDVKYKDVGRAPTPSDVYQLLAHAAAFRAETAFLVFPGEKFAVDFIGRAATGSRVVVFMVDPRALDHDAAQIAAALAAQGIASPDL
jgi:5-methylcytosine-specific restriction endonuclease McrBC regulatory subunit McrC